MLHLFHGEHTIASLAEIDKVCNHFQDQEIIRLEGKSLALVDFKQALESGSLFGSKRLVIVENLFTAKLGVKSKEAEDFIDYIKNFQSEAELVFWEAKEVKKSLLTKLPKNTDIALFKPDRNIFSFVESIKPAATKEMLERLEHALSADGPEMIFAMLVRQFRYLLIASEKGKNITDLTPWQATKFSKQAGFFSWEKLLQHYRTLLAIDIRQKSGTAVFDLTKEMELFLIEV